MAGDAPRHRRACRIGCRPRARPWRPRREGLPRRADRVDDAARRARATGRGRTAAARRSGRPAALPVAPARGRASRVRAGARPDPGRAESRRESAVTEVLWDVRLFDPETGIATEHQVVTFDGDAVASIDDAVGKPPHGAHDLAGATVLPDRKSTRLN